MLPRPRKRRSPLFRFALLACAGLCLCFPSGADADEKGPIGVVVSIGKLQVGPLLEEARAVGGADWRGETLRADKEKRPASPERMVQTLRRSYLEADFLRCLAMLQQPSLDLHRLLERGQREAAGQVGILAASCAHGAGDLDLARKLLRRAFVHELVTAAALKGSRPDLQELAETVRSDLLSKPRVQVEVRTRPTGARLVVDGGAHRCARTPCTVLLIRGEHWLAVERLGHTRRTVRRQFTHSTKLTLSLDAAGAADAREQLAWTLAAGRDPGTPEFARVTSTAFGGQVVVLAWRIGQKGHAILYDRRRDRIVARVSVRGKKRPAAASVRSVVQEWRGSEPRPFYTRPIFYVAVVGAAAVTGVVLYFALRPETKRYDIVFP